MDLTAASAGISAIRKSLLWAGESCGPERPRGKRTERPRDLPGAGRRVSPMHGTRNCKSTKHRDRQGICLTTATLFYVSPAVSGPNSG